MRDAPQRQSDTFLKPTVGRRRQCFRREARLVSRSIPRLKHGNRCAARLCGWEALEPRQLLAGVLTAHWLADDLLAELPAGGAVTSWHDKVSQIPATAGGTPQLQPNQIGGRALVDFDLSNGADSLFVDANVNPLTGADDFSVVVAFRTSADSLQGQSGSWFENTGIVDANQRGLGLDWGLSIDAQGQLSTGLGAGIGVEPQTLYSSTAGLNDGQLHVATVTRQQGTLTLYVDTMPPDQLVNASAFKRGRLDMVFGALTDRQTGFTGDLAEVRLYNGALTAGEVAALTATVQAFYSNSPPVAADDQYLVQEDALFFVSNTGQGVLQNDTDADTDPLTAVVVTEPAHGKLVLNANGTFIYDPDTNFYGVDTFTYVAQDFRASNLATVTFDVQSVYDPAIAVDDQYKLRPGEVLRIDTTTGLLFNDANPDQASLTTRLVDDVGNGDLMLGDDGSFVYDPMGFAGITSFRYQLDDGTQLSAPATVTLAVNSVPVASADTLKLREDIPFELTGPGGILDNDFDAEGTEDLTVIVVEPPTAGTLEAATDGGLTYVPMEDYVGSDTFSYRLSDGFDESEVVAVTLDVQPVNDPPLTIEDAYFVTPGGRLTVPAAQGILANDRDVETQPLSARLLSPATHGTVQIDEDGAFRYVPELDFEGEDEFYYTASDAQDESSGTRVTIRVVDQPLVINEVLSLNTGSLPTRTRAPDANRFAGDDQWFDWIEIYNRLPRPLDLGGLHLTDSATDPLRWQFPPQTIIPGEGYLVVFASGLNFVNPDQDEQGLLHTNFRLAAEGEYLALTNVDGAVIDALQPQGGAPTADVSFGRSAEGLRYFSEVSPGAANTAGLLGYTAGVEYDVPHGFMTEAFQLTIRSSDPEARIRYTLDGSEPTETSGVDYNLPLTISATTMVRAAAFKDEYVRSSVTTQTYVFLADVLQQSPMGEAPLGWPDRPVRGQAFDYGMDPEIVNDANWGPQLPDALTQIPSLSLVTEQSNLTDPRTGIYVNATQDGRAWERPASLELLNPDGSPGFQIDAGLRIRGGFSRGGFNPKHSFRLFFRDEYGGDLNFPLFEDEGVDRFQNIDLRTAARIMPGATIRSMTRRETASYAMSIRAICSAHRDSRTLAVATTTCMLTVNIGDCIKPRNVRKPPLRNRIWGVIKTITT